MNKPIQTGLASFGMSGYVFHAPLLHVNKGFDLKAIVERNLDESRVNFPHTRHYRSVEDLCADDDIELIIINLPDHLHFEYSKLALNSGKHVIVEKPFVQTVEQANILIQLAKEKNLVLSVFQNRRWDNDFITIKKLLEENVFGDLVDFEAHFDRFRDEIKEGIWKEDSETGAGILYNLGSHLIDQALVLFGWPHSIYADIRTTRPFSKIDDNFELILRYGRLKVVLKASYLVKEPGPRYTIHGTRGSFLKWGIDPQEDALKEGKIPEGSSLGIEDPEYHGVLNILKNGKEIRQKIETLPGNYNLFYDNIFDVIRNKADLKVKPEESRDVIRLIEAAFRSENEKRVIQL